MYIYIHVRLVITTVAVCCIPFLLSFNVKGATKKSVIDVVEIQYKSKMLFISDKE